MFPFEAAHTAVQLSAAMDAGQIILMRGCMHSDGGAVVVMAEIASGREVGVHIARSRLRCASARQAGLRILSFGFIGPAARRRSEVIQAKAADAGPVFLEVLFVIALTVRTFVQHYSLAAVFPRFVLAATCDTLGADFHEQAHGAGSHAPANEFLTRGFDVVHFI